MFFIFLTGAWMQSSLFQAEGSGFVGTKLLGCPFLVRKPTSSAGDTDSLLCIARLGLSDHPGMVNALQKDTNGNNLHLLPV